jgi:hypothetical protein
LQALMTVRPELPQKELQQQAQHAFSDAMKHIIRKFQRPLITTILQ